MDWEGRGHEPVSDAAHLFRDRPPNELCNHQFDLHSWLARRYVVLVGGRSPYRFVADGCGYRGWRERVLERSRARSWRFWDC